MAWATPRRSSSQRYWSEKWRQWSNTPPLKFDHRILILNPQTRRLNDHISRNPLRSRIVKDYPNPMNALPDGTIRETIKLVATPHRQDPSGFVIHLLTNSGLQLMWRSYYIFRPLPPVSPSPSRDTTNTTPSTWTAS